MDLRGYNSRTEWELLQGWQGFSALARGPQVFLHLEVEPATPQSTPRLPTARPCQLITPLLAPCKKEAMSSAAAQLVAYARPLLRQDGRDQEAVDSRRLRHGAGGRQAGRGAAPRQLGGRKGQRYSGGGENWPGPGRWWRGIGWCVFGRGWQVWRGQDGLCGQIGTVVSADRPVLVRFCGTSKGSFTGLGLVQSLCLSSSLSSDLLRHHAGSRSGLLVFTYIWLLKPWFS